MTVMEFLKGNVSSLDLHKPIELKDVVDNVGVYCGTGYNDLMEMLLTDGLNHVCNARFIMQAEENRNIIYYIKDIKNYSNFELIQVAEKLQR